MPAAAVIPAPIAYINVVAVKKLVVGPGGNGLSALCVVRDRSGHPREEASGIRLSGGDSRLLL